MDESLNYLDVIGAFLLVLIPVTKNLLQVKSSGFNVVSHGL